MRRRSLSIIMTMIFYGCAVPQTPRQIGIEAPISPEAQRQAQQSAQFPKVKTYKRRVAIGRFTNQTRYGKGLLLGTDIDPLGKQVSDILAADLVRSGRFLVFERPDLDTLVEEQKITGQADLVGVEAIILGSLSEFGRTTEGTTGFLSSTKRQRVHAKVNLRLVDPKTGHVFFSTTGTGEGTTESGEIAGFGSQAAYDATLNDRAIRAAISDLMNSLVGQLEARPWRTYILSIEGDQVFIGGGPLQGLRVGDELAVTQEGKQVRNRQTGFMIDLPGTEVARLQVTSFFGTSETDQGSICMVISGSLDGLALDKLYVTDVSEDTE